MEALLRRERLVVATALAALCGLAWIYILTGAGMGASAWDMTSVAPFPHASTEVARDAGMPGMATPELEEFRAMVERQLGVKRQL